MSKPDVLVISPMYNIFGPVDQLNKRLLQIFVEFKNRYHPKCFLRMCNFEFYIILLSRVIQSKFILDDVLAWDLGFHLL